MTLPVPDAPPTFDMVELWVRKEYPGARIEPAISLEIPEVYSNGTNGLTANCDVHSVTRKLKDIGAF